MFEVTVMLYLPFARNVWGVALPCYYAEQMKVKDRLNLISSWIRLFNNI